MSRKSTRDLRSKDASVTEPLFSFQTAESAGNAIKAFIPLILMMAVGF
ncbi:MAG: hypothetical protein OXN25_00675 [Candidatus Poribacteria bacterium]|nr:hypothetical protein [Candidatus Poribacteria bacterium]